MRWNCPHCGITLAISDEKIGTGWSFSRCYHCGGFALIRRSDVNLIKIDQAPPGENVLLPESSEQPLLSQEALRNFPKQKPIIKPAKRSTTGFAPTKPTAVSQDFKSGAELAKELAHQTQPNHPPPFLKSSLLTRQIPDPLPEEPGQQKNTNWIRFGIGISALIAVSSGTYLYIEGQKLWDKTRPSAQTLQKPEDIGSNETIASPSDSEIVRAPLIANLPQPTALQPKEQIVDQLQQNAMAPVHKTTPAVRVQEEEEQLAQEHSTKEQQQNLKQNSKIGLVVKPKYKTSPLRGGPGLQFPVLGTVNPKITYLVTDWKSEWFQVTIENLEEGMLYSPLTPKNLSKTLNKTAWIRNDLVQIIQ